MTQIPIHPQPSIYETTVAISEAIGDDYEALIDHRTVEEIQQRPRWTVGAAKVRATMVMSQKGWTRNDQGILVEPPKTRPSRAAKKKAHS